MKKLNFEVYGTAYILALSLLLSATSIKTKQLGKGEIYPFFDYKLYCTPDVDTFCFTFRLYVKPPGSNMYHRISEISEKNFTQDDFLYFTANAMKDSELHSDRVKMRMRSLGHFLYPGKNKYRLVEEKYNINQYCKGFYKPIETRIALEF